MDNLEKNQNFGAGACLVKEHVKRVYSTSDKLYQLKDRNPRLPPKILLHVWSKSCEGIIGVHDCVNEGIDYRNEAVVSVR